MITRRRRVGLVLVVGLGLLATTVSGGASGATAGPEIVAAPQAGGAAPGSDATIEVKVFSVEPGMVGDAAVACPAGKRVVGGGIGQVQSTSPTFGYVQQSGPLDETGSPANTRSGDIARSWSASVYNNSAAGTREYRVFALCSASSDATIAANPLPVEPSAVNSASIDCPAGRRVVGGGVGQPAATSPAFASVQRSGPVDQTGTTANTESGDVAESWFASVYNFRTGGETRDFRVFAICSAGSDATIEAKLSCEWRREERERGGVGTGERSVDASGELWYHAGDAGS